MPELARQSGDSGEGKVGRDGDALFLAEGGDIDLLALEIDRVAGVDGKLVGNVRIESADLWPDAAKRCEINVWIGEELEGAPLAAIAIDAEAYLSCLIRRKRKAFSSASPSASAFDLAAKALARPLPTQPAARPNGVRR